MSETMRQEPEGSFFVYDQDFEQVHRIHEAALPDGSFERMALLKGLHGALGSELSNRREAAARREQYFMIVQAQVNAGIEGYLGDVKEVAACLERVHLKTPTSPFHQVYGEALRNFGALLSRIDTDKNREWAGHDLAFRLTREPGEPAEQWEAIQRSVGLHSGRQFGLEGVADSVIIPLKDLRRTNLLHGLVSHPEEYLRINGESVHVPTLWVARPRFDFAIHTAGDEPGADGLQYGRHYTVPMHAVKSMALETLG